jgi:hypothetical protein
MDATLSGALMSQLIGGLVLSTGINWIPPIITIKTIKIFFKILTHFLLNR